MDTNARRVWDVGTRVVVLLLAFVLGVWWAGGDDPAPTPHDHAEHDQVWTCSMHPQIRQSEPGSCPICGMDLVLAGQEGGDVVPLVLSERARVLAQLRTTPVVRQSDMSGEVRLLGRIEPAETARRNVTTWVGGRIDRLQVNVTGTRIRKGEAVATLYSPEVYAAHQDLITAQRQVERLTGAATSTREAASRALEAAGERLRLLGVPSSQIDEMAHADVPTRALSIRTPFGGTVIERVATEGAYVETGATLYRVADLSTLWVQLDAYESDLARLSTGQQVALRVDALPGEIFDGRLAFIEPTVDADRRTARVRVEVVNPDGRLRPGLFAEAVVATGAEDDSAPLVVPATAPLFTGRRSVVYVEVGTERGVGYEPRTVRLGPRLGEVYPVVSGLSEGERVVSRGAFALDADLQIRGGPSMMHAADDRSGGGDIVPLQPEERAALAPILRAYLTVQTALAADELQGARDAAGRVVEAVDGVSLPVRVGEPWDEVSARLKGPAARVAAADGIEGAREGFEPLSLAVEELLVRFGNPLSDPLRVAFCPMARGSQGARWIQAGEVVDNAYFGDAMRRCGEIAAEVGPAQHLEATQTSGAVPWGHAGHDH